jgi:citrate lyase beta subunit
VFRPVQTLYGGADRFAADVVAKMGRIAREAFDRYVRSSGDIARIFAIDPEIAAAVYPRLRARLELKPLDDVRIDFEDGYGLRTDADEDAHAKQAAGRLAEAVNKKKLPPRIGIRIRALDGVTGKRALRTLSLFLAEYARGASSLPTDFVVTLPKVTHADEVSVLVDAVTALERRLGLHEGSIGLELVAETPQAFTGGSGSPLLGDRIGCEAMIVAGQGRCRGVHFGPYDYLSSLSVPASAQRLDHPSCEYGRHLLQHVCARHGLPLVDGPITLLPVEIHPGASEGSAEFEENRRSMEEGWRESFRQVRRALSGGIFQGWDLHPFQLVSRYAAVFSFFREGFPPVATRLRRFVEHAARATREGAAFDDEATARGLLLFVSRGHAAGALTDAELDAAGLPAAVKTAQSFRELLGTAAP